MKSVMLAGTKLPGAIGLALLLAACGGSDESAGESAEPVAAETAASSPSSASSAPAAGGAPASFAMCKACHAVEPGRNGLGPSLAGIHGTKAGDVEGFQFSQAMLDSGLIWDDATLDAFLADPRGTVPGTRMSFAGMKDEAKRKEVIEYIKSLK